MFHDNTTLLGDYRKNYHKLENPNLLNAHLEGPLGVRFPTLVGKEANFNDWTLLFGGTDQNLNFLPALDLLNKRCFSPALDLINKRRFFTLILFR